MRKHLLSFFLLVISLVCRAHDGENFVASDLFASLQPGFIDGTFWNNP